MQLTVTLLTPGGVRNIVFNHDRLPTGADNGWIRVTDTTFKITMKPGEDPQSWHPGVSFLCAGQITGAHDELFQATFQPAEPDSRYQIGSIDVVQLDDRVLEHSRAEIIVAIRGKAGNKELRLIPVSALDALNQ